MTTEKTRQLKKELRADFKAKRKAIDVEQKKHLDGSICESILKSVSYKYADVVLMFYPTDVEIDIRQVFEDAVKNGKRVAFPKCISKGIMKFYFVNSLNDFERSSFGLLEPTEVCEEYSAQKALHPICIVPSLCVSSDGKRLGYGGGFYDRFLSSFEGISMCTQYEMCIYEDIPFEKRYDKKVDVIVTERGVCVVGEK